MGFFSDLGSVLTGGSTEAEKRAERERKRAEENARNEREKNAAVTAANERRQKLEEERMATLRAEQRTKEDALQQQLLQKEKELKIEAAERQKQSERIHQQHMEQLQAQIQATKDEEKRRREEMLLMINNEKERQQRYEEIAKAERKVAAEKEERLMIQIQTREKNHAEAMMKIQNDMHVSLFNAQRDAEEKLREERKIQQKEADKMIAENREMYDKQLEATRQSHKETIGVLKDQLTDMKESNNKLHQNINDLLQQFIESRNDFLAYVKEKPEQDIVVPEGMEEILRKAKEQLKLDTANCFNFAFVGHTKTGKSSLINAIRGIRDNHPDAAKVGITETTHDISRYDFPDPEYKHVKIYDIPGAGTLTHDATSYYHDKCLCAFDCLVIVAQDTLGQEEIDFAIQSLRFNQPIAFVRSRCDIVLDNARKLGDIDEINQEAVVTYLNQLGEAYVKEIQRANKPELNKIPCFFVSSYSLRSLILGKKPEAIYKEQEFLDYIKNKSKYCRNIVS
jgi:hypothetical protein